MANLLKVKRLTQTNLQTLLQQLRPTNPIPPNIQTTVKRIIKDVENNGDKALIKYTKLLDKTTLTKQELTVTKEEIQEAYSKVKQQEIEALKTAKTNLKEVESKTLRQAEGLHWTKDGLQVKTLLTPIKSVGCYVPGGRATYPSTIIMTTTPAKTAGVSRVVVTTPPSDGKKMNPLMLVAADICSVDEIYRIGGAQAVAALAYGTETIKPVAKIVGPGNIYVAAAKLQVLDRVAIDLPAGPSEALIIADRNAEPRLVARDIICQAEHGSESVCGLLTDSEEFAGKVLNVLQSMLKQAGRREIISKALAAKGFTIICKDMEDAARFADSFAPEHLEIMADNAENIASSIRTAGLILVGEYSPAAATDYCVGTNHVLPTGGFGRVYSGLSILDYVRRYHVVECTEEGLKSIAGEVELLAEKEGLPNHAEAVRERFRSVG